MSRRALAGLLVVGSALTGLLQQLIAFLALQRFFYNGLTSGSIK